MLLCEAINFHDFRQWFQEVGVVQWVTASLTDEVQISKSRVNFLTNHMVPYK